MGSFTVMKETLLYLYKQNTLPASKTKCFTFSPMVSHLHNKTCYVARSKRKVCVIVTY